MKVDIFSTDGKSTGKSIDLPKEVFEVEANEHAVYLAVKQYLANQRQGTHKAKERGEIAGSMKKLKKQKGTGTARSGSIKNPLLRGGGRIFGPRPRTYGIKLNKKVKRLAAASALTSKAAAGKIMVVEDFTMDAPRTADFVSVLNNLEVKDQKTLFVVGDKDDNLYLSSRNLKKTSVRKASDINTYEIVNAAKLVLAESAVQKLAEQLG